MKKLKSVISVLLAVSMFFAFAVVSNAAAASVTARVDKTEASKGDTVTVTVSLNSNPGIAGVDFTLNYDSSKLQLQNVSKGSVSSNFDLASANSGDSTIKGAYLNSDGTATSKTGTLATVTFKVISDSDSKASISVAANSTDGNGDAVSTSASGTSVSLKKKVTTTDSPKTTNAPKTTNPTTTKTTKPSETTTVPQESTTRVIATETIAVKVGNIYQLARPSSMQGSIVFSSSNSSVVAVDNSGIVTTLSRGMSTIKAVSENGVTKTWLLIVGDDSTVQTTEVTTVEGEETTTELAVIGAVDDETTTASETTTKAKEEVKDKLDNGDETFKLIVGVGVAVAILVIFVVVASMIRKRKSFADEI